MSETNGVSGPERYVVGARLLGKDKHQKKISRIVEYAIEVVLSDESQYTTYRSIKEIAMLHSRLISRFPVEAGYFSKAERVIPECPVRQTIFGPQRTVRDDRSFEKLLNIYLKELPALPASIVKSNFMRNFFILRAADIHLPGQKNANADQKKRKKVKPLTRAISEDSTISGPLKLRSYYAVAPYSDQKSKFSFSEGAILQLLQKDPSGWWMVDIGGTIGWAPASFMVPVDEEDLPEEANENEQLIGVEKVGARYISISSYQASRDDELSFVRGAVVRVIQKYIDGWWLVRYNGGEGFVPGALFRKFDRRQSSVYVKKIKRKFISQKSVRIVPTMKPKWLSDQNGSAGGLTLYKCMAKFSGSSDRFEISLNKNDVVKVLDRKDHGWWYVEDLHGRSGWAPATYLKRVLDKEHQTNGPQGAELVGSIHEVLQSHRAQLGDELSVQTGERVVVIWTSDDGWWMVRNAETQQQGLIPSVCLKHASEGDPTNSSTLSIPDLNLDGDDTSTWSELERLQEDTTPFPESEDSHIYDDIAEFVEEECYIATQGYAKQAPDELDIDEGQLVCVIDDTHRDMWYVNVDGKEGWLPSSLLRIVTDEELGGSAATSPCRTKLSSHGASADASDLSDSDELGSFSPSVLLPRSSPVIQRRRGSSPLNLPKQFSLPESTAWNGRRKISLDGSELDRMVRSGRRKISLEIGSNRTAWSARRKISLGTSSDSELLEYTSAESPVTILVENRSLEELEKEAAQAEKMAEVAQRRAKALRDRARRLGSPGFSSD